MKSFLSIPSFLLAMAALAPATGHAAVVYSGPQNISITTGFDSVFIDVDGMSSLPDESAGWDIEAFFGGEGFGNSASFQPARQVVAMDSAIIRLGIGSVVDGSLNYFNQEAGSATHMGNGANQFASGAEGYLGFRLIDNGGDGPYYGWMRVNFSNTGGAGTIIDWAYDDSGSPINVGVIPEPSACALAGLASIAMAFRRRR